MVLNKLKRLHEFLLEQRFCSSEMLDSWMENAALETGMKNQGSSIEICRLRYDAIFSIENFSGSPDELFAKLSIWLLENDKTREAEELGDPKIDIDTTGTKTADVEISLEFVESIFAQEDVNGDLDLLGRSWSINPLLIDVADEISVGDSKDKALDLNYVHSD